MCVVGGSCYIFYLSLESTFRLGVGVDCNRVRVRCRHADVVVAVCYFVLKAADVLGC